MTIAYSKDDETEIVSVNTQTEIDTADLHDSFSRCFVPDRQGFKVLFECAGKTLELASGVASAPTDGKVCPVRIKVRIEPEAVEPKQVVPVEVLL